ncbi:hypothetical protein IV203_005814 [Nitzschia inconspicua]|uniref:Uncharacterized protein n=1 Tax=Nitzschia inconspicua TaxID=303405 RepID=A0A9K3KN29_9STRA|nr:hypothetical protein IV203_005814 [Nitzschia inconspicua]
MSEKTPASVTFAPTTVSSAAPAPAPAASTANGAGNNGNGGSSRHRGRNRHRGNHVPSSSTSNSSNSSASSYKGDIPGMNGHVFQVYSESSDPKQFSATCNALQQYVEINMALEIVKEDNSTTPTTPCDTHIRMTSEGENKNDISLQHSFKVKLKV